MLAFAAKCNVWECPYRSFDENKGVNGSDFQCTKSRKDDGKDYFLN